MRIGFIGGGGIARHHAECVTDLGHDVIAVADVDRDARDSFAGTYDADSTYGDYEAMLDAEELDVGVVAVPNALHADCAVAVLERDVNVFVEKPLAHDLAAAERIADAEADSQGDVMVGFMKAFDPKVEAIDAGVNEGEFGEVYEVSVEYVRRRGIPQIGSWFTREEVAGGGAVIDIGPHMLHLALHLMEFPAIESASATAGTHFGDEEEYTYLDMWGGDPIEGSEFDVDDHARALLRTESGTVHLDVAWASNREPRQRVEVSGDQAGATLDVREGDLTIHSTRRGGLSDETFELPERDPYEAEWRYFSAILEEGREHTRNTVEEGLHVQRAIAAIYDSAQRGEEIGSG